MESKPLLFVEGKNDEHVFYSILEKYGVPDTFKIVDQKGISNILKALPLLLIPKPFLTGKS
jgi:hypothetical protein